MTEREKLINCLCSAPLGSKTFEEQYYKSTIARIADYLLEKKYHRKGNNMNIHDMTEEAYKNGYEKGIKDFAEKLRRECHTDCQGFYVVLIDEITALEEKLIGLDKKKDN